MLHHVSLKRHSTLTKSMSKQSISIYVALSRVRKLEGLFLDGKFIQPISNTAAKKVDREISRLLNLCPVEFQLPFLQK